MHLPVPVPNLISYNETVILFPATRRFTVVLHLANGPLISGRKHVPREEM